MSAAISLTRDAAGARICDIVWWESTSYFQGIRAVNAAYAGGEFITKPFTFTGRELEINMSTSAAGGIKSNHPH